jgi:hypothetical protein
MKFNSEKGVTGINVAIAIVVLFIFVSIIASLSYSFNSKSKELEYKSEATNIAISEIEAVKAKGFLEYENKSKNDCLDSDGNLTYEAISGKTGYYEAILVEDYSDLYPEKEEKVSGLVKKVTVSIKYTFKGNEQTVELSTALAKDS